jgi:hypothetical protein
MMADTDYYLQRAKSEAVRALQADHPSAAASHQGLSVRYSALAALGLLDEQDTPKEKVRHRELRAALTQV